VQSAVFVRVTSVRVKVRAVNVLVIVLVTEAVAASLQYFQINMRSLYGVYV